MANRIDKLFRKLRRQNRKALIGYITAGYPHKKSTLELVPRLAQAGVDLLEIGVPFSDPIADGPTIQAASQKALQNGVNLRWILATVAALRRKNQLPIVLMTYCNPILAMGGDRFFRLARTAGVDGVIIPDLTPEEGADFGNSASNNEIDMIYLVAPTSSEKRIRAVVRYSRGFVYAVSLTGVTGARSRIASSSKTFLQTVKRISGKPVAIGFGLSTARQVRQMSAVADGVIVGSALINEIAKDRSYNHAVKFVALLRRALDGGKDVSHAA
jgi:tryptophan synthase alpha chain